MIKYHEKVVGSTFAGINVSLLFPNTEYNGKDIPVNTFNATIVPEPENPYDEYAKRVYLTIDNEDMNPEQVFIGFIGKSSPLYNRIKNYKHKSIDAIVNVHAHHYRGANDSYQIDVTL